MMDFHAVTTSALPGTYRLRAATLGDASPIAAMIKGYDLEIAGLSDFVEDDLLELFRNAHTDLDRDSFLIHDDSGEVAAFGYLWHADPGVILLSFGVVDQAHTGRGLGRALVVSLEGRAREILTAGDRDAVVLRMFVDIKDEGGMALAERSGFAPVRRQYTMLIDLEDVDLSGPIDIDARTGSAKDARLMHELTDETFSEHWGHVPKSFEDWSHQVMEREDLDTTLWWVAMENDHPIGILMGSVVDDMGWVAVLGVRKPWRKKGIGATLLRVAFREFRKRGLSKAGLGVDSKNKTGAVRLYESVGMRVARCYETFEKSYAREPS